MLLWIQLTLKIFVLLCLTTNAVIINDEIHRTIDISSPILRITIEIKASHIDGEYEICFHDYIAKHIAYLSVNSKGNLLKTTAPVNANNMTYYSIRTSESTISLKVLAVFTDTLFPYPEEISQYDSQYVLFQDNHYVSTPYSTSLQKTTVKLSSNQIESVTKLEPQSTRGSTIICGPYKDIEPGKTHPLVIHYMNNKPFAKFTSINREIEVSHWGNVYVEEVYELQHAGAKLKDGFSRYDYMMRTSSDTPYFSGLKALLPIQATNIYYRDQIGNISTSDITVHAAKGELELAVETRFPLFGGWKTQFYIGYSLPTEVCLFQNNQDGKYKLKFDFFTVFQNVWVDELEIKVILPEGAEDFDVNVPYAVEQSSSRRYTFLDSHFNGGRPVLTFKAKNVVPEHDGQVVITYTFDKTRMLFEPAVLISSFFLFFVCCMALTRLDASSASSTKSTSKP